jgi:hypothetical protein
MPLNILQQLSRSEIFQLNTAMLKESKVAGKLQTNTKLTLNAQQLRRMRHAPRLVCDTRSIISRTQA